MKTFIYLETNPIIDHWRQNVKSKSRASHCLNANMTRTQDISHKLLLQMRSTYCFVSLLKV